MVISLYNIRRRPSIGDYRVEPDYDEPWREQTIMYGEVQGQFIRPEWKRIPLWRLVNKGNMPRPIGGWFRRRYIPRWMKEID